WLTPSTFEHRVCTRSWAEKPFPISKSTVTSTTKSPSASASRRTPSKRFSSWQYSTDPSTCCKPWSTRLVKCATLTTFCRTNSRQLHSRSKRPCASRTKKKETCWQRFFVTKPRSTNWRRKLRCWTNFSSATMSNCSRFCTRTDGIWTTQSTTKESSRSVTHSR
ncbi:hypothetical protein BGZ52_000098, partial [Haplosporangium bisporale]